MRLQITNLGTEFSVSDEEVAGIRDRFDRLHCLRLPQFLSPDLLRMIQGHLAEATTTSAAYDGVGTETLVEFGRSTAAIELTINDPRLYGAIEQLTGVGPIANLNGRVYQMDSGEHGFDWHDDNVRHRVIGFSLNLGTRLFSGGRLQVAETGTHKIVCEVANTVAGDAVIFRIGPQVVHRVTPLEGTVPRVAYSGWFCTEPSYQELLRERWTQVRAARAGRSPS